MGLKRKIAKAAFDAFAGEEAWKKSAYKVDPSDANSYVLDAEADEGVTAALNAKQHEIDQHAQTKRELETVKSERDTIKGERDTLQAEKRAGWKKDPDRDAIETDLNNKLNAEKEGRTKDKEAADKKLSDYVRTSKANELAEELSTVPTMFAKEIAERLTVDLTGDKPVVRVLDKDGKASATSLTELKQEFVDNPAFKSIIKASNASGGGAGPGNNGGGGAQPKALKDMTEAERVQFHKTNPTEFARQTAELQAASAGYR